MRIPPTIPFLVRGAFVALLVVIALGLVVLLSFQAQPASAADVVSVTAGERHTCALSSEGGVKCWGWNGFGQLGDGTFVDRDTAVDVLAAPGGGALTGVVEIAAGPRHTCAVIQGGTVKCWGYNPDGQLGDGSTTNRTTPVDVLGLTAVSVTAGGRWQAGHSCALTEDGGVKCWGANDRGQLGDGTTDDRLTPVDVSGLSSGVSAIDAGGGSYLLGQGSQTCAVTTAATAKCWGSNGFGQLGDGTRTTRLTPVDVSGLQNATVSISSGGLHTCAVTTTGAARCWGLNSVGQLGNGATGSITGGDFTTPVDVSGLGEGVTTVDAGGMHTCAVVSAALKCWGYNIQGQLGDGTTVESRNTPVAVVGLSSGVRGVATSQSVSVLDRGPWHSCAITAIEGVKCWGNNLHGQLGNGTTTDSKTPVEVVDIKPTMPPPTPTVPAVVEPIVCATVDTAFCDLVYKVDSFLQAADFSSVLSNTTLTEQDCAFWRDLGEPPHQGEAPSECDGRPPEYVPECVEWGGYGLAHPHLSCFTPEEYAVELSDLAVIGVSYSCPAEGCRGILFLKDPTEPLSGDSFSDIGRILSAVPNGEGWFIRSGGGGLVFYFFGYPDFSWPPAATSEPEIPVASITPTSGPAGTQFTVEWSGFTPDSTLTSHLRRLPDDPELGTIQFVTAADGSAGHIIDSTTLAPGTYEHWAVDDETGVQTPPVQFVVEEPIVVVAPVANISPASAPAGTSFAIQWSGFTENSTLTSHLQSRDGGMDFDDIQVVTNEAGSASWPVNSYGFVPGTYEHWADDDTTGLQTDVVTFEVTETLIVADGAVYPAQAEPGQTLDLVYCIGNPTGRNVDTILTASIRPAGSADGSFVDTGRNVQVQAVPTGVGACQDYARQFQLPDGLAQGLYDVTWTLERVDGPGEYDRRKYEAILRIGSEPDPRSQEQQLADRFAPILYLTNGDYEPKEVQIMLDEPGGRDNETTELRRRIDRTLWPDTSEPIPGVDFPTVGSLETNSAANNYIDIREMSPGDEDLYRERYRLLANRYDTVTYADIGRERLSCSAPGVCIGGQLYIDYWFFYYYNDYFSQDHEGDWERIRIRTGAFTMDDALSNTPAAIGVSRHFCDGSLRSLAYEPWPPPRVDGTHPIVFAADGSHANYLAPGRYAPPAVQLCVGGTGVFTDNVENDVRLTPEGVERQEGDRPMDVRLIDCGNPAPGQEWLSFWGRWGEWGGGPRGPCRAQQIQPGGTISQLESIARDQVNALFTATWDQIFASGGVTGFQSGSTVSDIRMSLTSPSGRLIDRDTVASDVEHELTATSERFTITEPESGDWTITLLAADVPPEGASVEIGFGTIPEPVVFGDVSCDGLVDPVDAALVLQLAAGLLDSLACEDEADTNLDGQINPLDAALILQFAAGLISSLPP